MYVIIIFIVPDPSVPVLYHSETSPKISTTRPKVDTGLNGRRTGAPPTSYISRTTTALQSVAEEHWRRQMSLERDEQVRNGLVALICVHCSRYEAVIHGQ